ncbi:hypothetical protein PIB30_063254 [Stylosanthes scabra]|uniref:Reverse transcriptase n=1 Tax=Stylosanthes scabra TaxID=79078 RepID=A0ABU6ZK21_9FABA|nr:hypothetical protein [Stylosanthes scabra]
MSKAVCSRHVSSRRRELLRGVSNIRFANDLDKYLGINLNHARSTRGACMEAVKKIRNRLASWEGRLLSKAGAEIFSSTLSRTFASRLHWSFHSGNGTHMRNSGFRNVKNVHIRRRCRGSLLLTQEYTRIWKR